MSGIDLSGLPFTVGLGGASLGNHRRALTEQQAYDVLEAAWSAGIRSFDTAPHYGLGLSESRLGAFLAGCPRSEFEVSTKVGRRLVAQPNPDRALDDEGFVVPADSRRVWDVGTDGVQTTLEASLARLGLRSVDVAYLHDPERAGGPDALASGVEALLALRDGGLAGRVGVGSMDVGALTRAAGRAELDDLMVAGRLTVLDDSACAGVLPGCAAHGIAVTAAAVLNGGLLAAARVEDGTFDYAPPADGVLARARRVADVCRGYDVPPAAVALQFPVRFAPVRRLVLGFDEPAHVRAAVAWLHVDVPDDLWAELDTELRGAA